MVTVCNKVAFFISEFGADLKIPKCLGWTKVNSSLAAFCWVFFTFTLTSCHHLTFLSFLMILILVKLRFLFVGWFDCVTRKPVSLSLWRIPSISPALSSPAMPNSTICLLSCTPTFWMPGTTSISANAANLPSSKLWTKTCVLSLTLWMVRTGQILLWGLAAKGKI